MVIYGQRRVLGGSHSPEYIYKRKAATFKKANYLYLFPFLVGVEMISLEYTIIHMFFIMWR